MASQGCHGEKLGIRISKSQFLGPAEHIHHCHPTLSISVAHPDPHPRPARDDLVRHIAVRSNAISHHCQGCDNLDSLWLQGCNRSHYPCGCTLVTGHTCHDTSGLDVSATSVVGDSLAN